MQHQTNTISKSSIPFIIAESNLEVLWDLYNKYEPAMIVTICKFAEDNTITESILEESYPQLKERGIKSSKNAIQQNGVQTENIHLFSNPINY